MKPATLSWCTEIVLMFVGALVERVDELDVAVAAQAEHLRHFLLDQVVDDDLGAVEHITRHRFTLSLPLNGFPASAS